MVVTFFYPYLGMQLLNDKNVSLKCLVLAIFTVKIAYNIVREGVGI